MFPIVLLALLSNTICFPPTGTNLLHFQSSDKTDKLTVISCFLRTDCYTVHTRNALILIGHLRIVQRNGTCRAFFCAQTAGSAFSICNRFERNTTIFSIWSVSRKYRCPLCFAVLHNLCGKLQQFLFILLIWASGSNWCIRECSATASIPAIHTKPDAPEHPAVPIRYRQSYGFQILPQELSSYHLSLLCGTYPLH